MDGMRIEENMPKNGGREQKNYRDAKKTCNIKIF